LKKFIFFFFLLILTISVTASTLTSEQTGINAASTYEGGSSNFNADVVIETAGSRALSTRKNFSSFHVADVDNDSVNELLIIDGNVIEIYSDKTLEIEETLSYTALVGDFQLHDIDNDGVVEIILVDATIAKKVDYNGTSYATTTLGGMGIAYEGNPNAQTAIKCKDQKCGIVEVQCSYTGVAVSIKKTCNMVFAIVNSTTVSNIYVIGNDTNKADNVGKCYQLP